PVQFYYGHKHNDAISSVSSQLSFPVTGPVKLSISDEAAGLIRIHTGDTNQVVVSETSQSENRAFTSDTLPIKPVQVDNTLNITINNDLENDDSTGVILDVYTPRDTSVDINASSASINIEN